MTLPIHPINWPSAVLGKLNGLLPTGTLHVLADLPQITLVGPAMRAWLALSAAAHEAGHVLHATGAADSYRSLAAQENLFKVRYTLIRPAGLATEHKIWQGKTWWLIPGQATAAVPGTSNHGWGIAVDVANASGALLTWLVAHAWTYGWSWELQSEPWHIRYCTGDNIPQAVLAYEQRNADVDANTLRKIDAVFNVYETVKLDVVNHEGETQLDAQQGSFPVPFTKRLDAIDAQLAEVLRLLKGVSP